MDRFYWLCQGVNLQAGCSTRVAQQKNNQLGWKAGTAVSSVRVHQGVQFGVWVSLNSGSSAGLIPEREGGRRSGRKAAWLEQRWLGGTLAGMDSDC